MLSKCVWTKDDTKFIIIAAQQPDESYYDYFIPMASLKALVSGSIQMADFEKEAYVATGYQATMSLRDGGKPLDIPPLPAGLSGHSDSCGCSGHGKGGKAKGKAGRG